MGIFEKLLKKNKAPEWFCRDLKNNIPEEKIKEKICIEICNEVIRNNFDKRLWTEDFIIRTGNLYYKFFDQLYMQSA